jgi:hypothetical protein
MRHESYGRRTTDVAVCERALGLLTVISTRNLFEGVKWWPARKADNLTTISESTVYRRCRSLDLSQPYGPSRPVTWIA